MAYVESYSQVTIGSIPAEVWDEAWFTVMSWKGFLQSAPGFRDFRASARRLPNGDVRFMTTISWERVEQLEEWLRSKYALGELLRSMDMPAYDIVDESYEDLSM